MRRSLRLRLLVIGAFAIVATLGLAALGLALLFERHVERVAVGDLEARALTLAGIVEYDAKGMPRLPAPPADRLYQQPFSGHYWQVALDGEVRRSRSLWDYTLPMDRPAPPPGRTEVLGLPGPQGEPLLAVEQSLLVGRGQDTRRLRILMATDRAALTAARRGFLGDLIPYLAFLGLLLVGGSWLQIRVGLSPLAEVAFRVQALTHGRRSRIGTDLPDEMLPLARQMDTLLDARDAELLRARHRAGDLAHGFKTPLQALLGDADTLRDRGQADIAASVEIVVTAMRRLVDRELARARIQSDHHTAQADPAAIVARLIRVLRRTPRGAGIVWDIRAPGPAPRARIDPDDLTEALGALLENAMQHAASRVDIVVAPQTDRVILTIRDDGPGVPAESLARLSQRGMRLDEGGEGQGIGLALVSDIMDAANGRMDVSNADPGLCVRLTLAAVPAGR
ncbi:HAMP domain-containing histidine kinase [Paracoccus sediminis]|uniref:histidine kinase n=1 Tax=Paracoccus sediminis TaxID=1214787 RepID=A0A238UXH6_9RHOB|nr:HAMP domain-containing sensor histidine kinase [Paracoccus sediminis]TBN52682.1 HAMP domain-containing histidine kinase [Paracoccus sediminis]SNR26688.1 Signal transduction histidine kinase [Paracoccus sediminis]